MVTLSMTKFSSSEKFLCVKCDKHLRPEASRPPMTLAVTALPTFTDDVGKDPWRTCESSITSDTCTLPVIPFSSATWMKAGFTVRTLPCTISPKQRPRGPVTLSEVVRCHFGALRSHDTRGSPCASWQLASMTSADKHIPSFSFSDSNKSTSFRWLLVWITVSCAVSSSEMTAKSLSRCCTVAEYFVPSFNCENTNKNCSRSRRNKHDLPRCWETSKWHQQV